jgi:HEAT repeat protein
MNFMQKIAIGVSAVLCGMLGFSGMAIGGQEPMSTCIEDMKSDRLAAKVPNWKKEDYRACWKAVEQSFSHKNPEVRILGLKTLSSFGGIEDIHEFKHDFERWSPTLETAMKSLFQSQYLPEKVAVVKAWRDIQFRGFDLKIVPLLTESRTELREAAEDALSRAYHLEDETIHQLLSLLKHPNLQVRLSALRILEGAGNSNAIVNAISPLVSDPLPQIRAAAIKSLGYMRKISVDQLPLLVALLEDSDAQVRHAALIGVQSLGRNGRFAIPQIQKMLNDPNPEIRADAIEVLLFAEEDFEKFFSQAIAMLKDADPDVRKSALMSLRSFGVKAPQYSVRIVVLARPFLNDSSLKVRNEAMLVVGILDDDKSIFLNK